MIRPNNEAFSLFHPTEEKVVALTEAEGPFSRRIDTGEEYSLRAKNSHDVKQYVRQI